MPGILSVGELQALTVQMGTPPLQRAEMIHTSRYLYNICNFSKCQLEYIKNTKVFFCTSRKRRRGTGRRGWEREMREGERDGGGRGREEGERWRREAMEEGEGDEEMKKVSVWMHSCLLCTDSCTQGHTHKHKQMHTHTLASITSASLAPSAGCFCSWSFPNCGLFQGPARPALFTSGSVTSDFLCLS